MLERAATPGELGFALLLAPNAMLALRALGLADRVRAGGTVAEHGEIRRADGKVLRHLDFRPIHDRLGAPSVMVLRTVLHGALLDAVGPAALRLGNPVTSVAPDTDGALVTLASGEQRRAQLIVGADGVGSVVRKTLHPDEPAPRWKRACSPCAVSRAACPTSAPRSTTAAAAKPEPRPRDPTRCTGS